MKLFLFLTLFLSINSSAALVDRGDGLVYDTNLDITWLGDANYAKTLGYDLNGAMTHYESLVWVGNLEYLGFTEWRLPSTNAIAPTSGFNDDTSDLGNLYYQTTDTPTYFNMIAPDEFVNVKTSASYWLQESVSGDSAWVFHVQNGLQIPRDSSSSRYAWAVHDGDIGTELSVTGIPIPAATFLFSSAIISLIIARKLI